MIVTYRYRVKDKHAARACIRDLAEALGYYATEPDYETDSKVAEKALTKHAKTIEECK